MTLIIHIWTDKINLIAADRRLTNLSFPNPIVSDNTRKIYRNHNSFFAFHGDYDINPEMNISNLIGGFYDNDFQIHSTTDIANKLNNLVIQNRNRVLSTGFIIGGAFDRTEAIYLKNNRLIFDHNNLNIGMRFNYESESQKLRLREILDYSINKITNNHSNNWEKYNDYDDQIFLDIFNLFFINVFSDEIANQNNGIGSTFDLGIIRDKKFKWIQLLD